jgi:hypothetical protein
LDQSKSGIDVLGERPQEIVDDAGAAHGCYLSGDLADAAGGVVVLGG